MTEFADAAERALIRTATGETLFVEAGAGTGKTTALVSRVLALVDEGVPIEQITAITFTEKAASELGEKVRKELEEQLEAAEAKRAPNADLLRKAVQGLDQAAIQTLHGFAMRILSLYPLEARLPPRIRLRDDVEATLAFQERWQRFQDELLADPEAEPHLLRALTIGLRLRDLQEVAELLNESWERLPGADLPAAALPRLAPARILAPLAEVAAARRPGIDDSLSRKLTLLEGYLGFIRGLARDIASATAQTERDALELDLLRLLAKMPVITNSNSGQARGGLGRAGNWDDIARMRDLMAEAEDARRDMLDGTRTACICALLPHLRDFVLRGVEERRKLGELEYHDLLVRARDLLRENAEVRRALHGRFRRILIDEFQDTDPLQIELAALLASPGEAPVAWELATAEPGRLFFVGDPKQSIYRFRRADIELFKRARSAFASRHVPLMQNFRCRPAIIEWVNCVGEQLFSRFGTGADVRQADWIPLHAARPAGKGPAVFLLGGPRDLQAPQLREEEARCVVAAIQTARAENWLKRDDPKVKETRFADIAILLPTRTNSAAIERALGRAGIPVRVESRSLLFAAQEIRDLTNILAAIDDPTDDVSVVAALRSPAFGVQDGELLAHVNAGGRWDYTRDTPADSPEPVSSGMQSLRELHAARWTSSIGALVERVIAERKMLELAITGPRPREAWRRFRFVSEQARALGDAGTVGSLRQFVHWLRTQAAEGARIAEAVANEPDDDAVRLLTIHAAKGLEFPIVILAGLGIPPNNRQPRVGWLRQGDREALAVHAGRADTPFDTPGFDVFKQAEREHGFLERDRLFYVAATRAKERLVVSAFYRPYPKQTHAARHKDQKCAVAECLDEMRSSHPEWETLQHGMALGVGEPAVSVHEDTPEDRAAWAADRAARIAALGRAKMVAATTLAHEAQEAPPDDKPEPTAEAEPWKKGRAGTSIGRAVHAVLQTVDLTSGEGLVETARTQAVAEGIAGDADRIARLAESARTSAAVREAVASGRAMREVYAGAVIDGVLVEGFIDLLYEGPRGLVVIDYKTDSARDDAAIDHAMERYRLQGAAYALLLEEALGRPVDRCLFVFSEPRQEREVHDLDAAKAEVRRLIAERAAPLPV